MRLLILFLFMFLSLHISFALEGYPELPKVPESVYSPNSSAIGRDPVSPEPLPEFSGAGDFRVLATPQGSEYVYLGDWYDWQYYAVYLFSNGSITVEVSAPYCWDSSGAECTDLLDLYLRDDGVPTSTVYDVVSASSGSTESATDSSASEGWYYIGIKRLLDRRGWYTIKVTTPLGEKSTDEVFIFLNSDIGRHHFTTYIFGNVRSITGATDGISGVDLLDLYLRDDDLASPENYNASSVTTSEDEFARDYYPDSGWYYASAQHYTGEGYFSFWFNLPPYTPSTPSGPSSGYVNEPQTFSTYAYEPDGNLLSYCFDWGDGTPYTCTSYVSGGTTKSESHAYSTPGSYCVSAQAEDSDGEKSYWSDCALIQIRSHPPYAPDSPSPYDGERGVLVETTLSWNGGDPDGDVVYYDVYLKEEGGSYTKVCSGVYSETCDPGTLKESTTYYWYVVATDEWGESTTGNVWTFTTNFPPDTPSYPSPYDGENWVSISTDLRWLGGDPDGDTVYYNVSFGTTSPPPLVSERQKGTIYDPGTLSYSTTYYWKITAIDEHGAITEGPIWSFTTDSEPSDGDTVPVEIEQNLNKVRDVFGEIFPDPNKDDAYDTMTVAKEFYSGPSSSFKWYKERKR